MTNANQTPATERYTTASLNEIAAYFEDIASDQIAARRWQGTKREVAECDIRAAVWRDAASILRRVDLVPAASA